jgi:hypothetical protein
MGTAQVTEWDLDKSQSVAGGVDMVVDFDPKSLALTYSPTGPAQGSANTVSGTYSESPTQQTGQSTTLAMDLTFDTTFDGTTVQAKTDQLVLLTRPAPLGSTAPARKVVRISWGAFLFYGTISSLTQTIDFFSDAGIPLRADVHVTLSEVKPPDPSAGTGSGIGAGLGASVSASASIGASVSFGASAGLSAGASAGLSAGASAGFSAGVSAGLSAGASAGASIGTTPLTLTQSGDSMQAIAARAGGSASWKTVAAANGIDNPRMMPPGTIIDANASLQVS